MTIWVCCCPEIAQWHGQRYFCQLPGCLSLPLTSTCHLSSLDKKAEIDILAAEYISTVKTLSSAQRVEHLQKIQNAYSKCKEYSDDKVQLAMQTYEMVSAGERVQVCEDVWKCVRVCESV